MVQDELLIITTSLPIKCGAEKRKDHLPKKKEKIGYQLSLWHLIDIFFENNEMIHLLDHGFYEYYVDFKLKS